MLLGLSPDEKRNLLLSVGSHRDDRPLSPEEVARAFHRAVEAGSTLKDIAVLVHFDGTTMVTRFTRLLKLPSDVLRVIGWGQSKRTISFTAASEISRLKSSAEQVALAVGALGADFTTSEVKAVVQMRLRSDETIQSCMEAIEKLRGTTIRRHVIMGELLDDDLRTNLKALSQNERDSILVAALDSMLPEGHDVAGRLSGERFTLTTERDQHAKTISGSSTGMEAEVTEAVRAALKRVGSL